MELFPAWFQSGKTRVVFVLRLYILNLNIPVALLTVSGLIVNSKRVRQRNLSDP